MTRIKIGKDERNLIIFVICLISVSILFWIFLYLPKKREVQLLDNKIKEFGINIEKAKTELDKTREYENKVASMQKEINELETRFPKETELSSILKYIFEEAKSNFLEIENISPGEMKQYVPRNPSLDITQLNCQKKIFELRLKCRLRDLADFLKTLRDNHRYIFSIEDLEITKEKEILPQLKIRLVVGVYVLAS